MKSEIWNGTINVSAIRSGKSQDILAKSIEDIYKILLEHKKSIDNITKSIDIIIKELFEDDNEKN